MNSLLCSKRFTLILFLLFTTSIAFAQNGSISGTVITSDGKAAESVNVALKGTVTKQITLDASVRTGTGMQNKPAAGFKISGTINRTNFGITKYPAALLGDEVTLNANGEFDKE